MLAANAPPLVAAGAGAAAAATYAGCRAAVLATADDHAAVVGRCVRVLSFNVNGLRACLKRLRCTMAQLLDTLAADVVCFQETKLRRSDLDSELACVDGWDSFFCCDTTSSTGYSGTATYCRTGVALPFAAEEGFTGCAQPAGGGGTGGLAAAAAAPVSPHPTLAEHFTVEELSELDAEGRVVVTDHGAFVLFNLYGPAITSEDDERAEERARFKKRFYRALELRWRHLLAQGRAVVAVGDFNIAPAPMDCAEPDPAQHYRSSIRRWMRHLLHGSSSVGGGGGGGASRLAADLTSSGGHAGTLAAAVAVAADAEVPEEDDSPRWQEARGPAFGGNGSAGSQSSIGRDARFVDTFRHFHPTRTDVATCWSTLTNARVNDFGSRIDLILTAGLSVGQPPAHAAGPAPTAAQQPGLGPQGSRAGGGDCAGGAAVWVAASEIWKQQQGSDHCPVYADFVCCGGAVFPCSAKAPSTAMRNVFVGKQHKLHKWLAPVPPGCRAAAAATAATTTAAACGEGGGTTVPSSQQQQHEQQQRGPERAVPSQPDTAAASQGSSAAGGSQGGAAAGGAAPKKEGRKQASLKAFFRPPPAPNQPPQQQQSQSQSQSQQQEQEQEPAQSLQQQEHAQQQAEQQSQQCSQSPEPGRSDLSSDADAAAAAEAEAAAEAARASKMQQTKAAWAGLLARTKAPVCLHNEPAALLKVNKSGPNKGRFFYTCARAAGPPPEGKCNFFKWVEKKAGDSRWTTLGGSTKAGSAGSGGAPPSKRFKA